MLQMPYRYSEMRRRLYAAQLVCSVRPEIGQRADKVHLENSFHYPDYFSEHSTSQQVVTLTLAVASEVRLVRSGNCNWLSHSSTGE
jgi:hypothetical protein